MDAISNGLRPFLNVSKTVYPKMFFLSLRVHKDSFPVMGFRPDFTDFTRGSKKKKIPFRPAGPKRVFMNPSE